MDVYQAIVSKRDTRTFRDEPVAEEDLQQVLQAARMAGSAKNEQVNRLIVVTDKDDRAKLGECGKLADWIPGAPAVIAIVVPKEGGRPFDMGRMAQNMLVMANALGLGSCPVTFHDQDCVRQLLGIPEDYEAPMGVGIGHPAPDDEGESAPRLPLEELVDWGRWQS